VRPPAVATLAMGRGERRGGRRYIVERARRGRRVTPRNSGDLLILLCRSAKREILGALDQTAARRASGSCAWSSSSSASPGGASPPACNPTTRSVGTARRSRGPGRPPVHSPPGSHGWVPGHARRAWSVAFDGRAILRRGEPKRPPLEKGATDETSH